MNRRSLTLVELIVASVLLGITILGIARGSIFFVEQVSANLERQHIYTQINYAIDDMKLRCMGARATSTPLTPGGTRSDLEFIGERDIYNVTPDITTDDRCYKYFVSSAGDLKLRTCTSCPCNSALSEDTLVDGRFSPSLSFKHAVGDEPNYITVTIGANTSKTTIGLSNAISKTEGLRFWFVYIVQ